MKKYFDTSIIAGAFGILFFIGSEKDNVPAPVGTDSTFHVCRATTTVAAKKPTPAQIRNILIANE